MAPHTRATAGSGGSLHVQEGVRLGECLLHANGATAVQLAHLMLVTRLLL